MTKERIEIIRQSLIPFVKKELLEINDGGLGESDAEEFEKDLNEVLDLASKTLEQQSSEDCVSRAELKKWLDMNFSFGGALRKIEMFDRMDKELPSVTPTQCIAAVRFSKEDLRDICNERIEIECTHGTCKDCKHIYCEHHEETCDIDEYNPNFYCADFKKRGSENESIN